jgi:hypothetical protein
MTETQTTVPLNDVAMDFIIDRLSKRKDVLSQETEQIRQALFANAGAIDEIEKQLSYWRAKRGLDGPTMTMDELQRAITRSAELPPK